MKKIITLSQLMMVLLLMATCVTKMQAQQSATATKADLQKHTNNAQVVKQPTASSPKATGFVYENYKGITNREEAKKEWIKDNPEAYKKIIHPSAASNGSNPNEKNDSH